MVVVCSDLMSALSLTLRDKDRFRDYEIERAWQYSNFRHQNGEEIFDSPIVANHITLHSKYSLLFTYLTSKRHFMQQFMHIFLPFEPFLSWYLNHS